MSAQPLQSAKRDQADDDVSWAFGCHLDMKASKQAQPSRWVSDEV